jgi:hypothetical protein
MNAANNVLMLPSYHFEAWRPPSRQSEGLDIVWPSDSWRETQRSTWITSVCFVLFFFYALKPKLLRFTDTLVWALWHCVWEGATVQPMDSLDQSTLPLPEVIWGNIPCDLHPRHPKHPKTPNRCNIEKATKKPWWTGIGQCIQKTTC